MPKNYICSKEAKNSILLKYLYPQKLVNDNFFNRTGTNKLDGAIVECYKEKKVTRKQQLCCIFTEILFLDSEVHCVEQYARLTKEGPINLFYYAFVTRGGNPETLGTVQQLDVNDVEVLKETPVVCFWNFSRQPKLCTCYGGRPVRNWQ